jgi:hypothetical protein
MVSLLDYYARQKSLKVATRRAGIDAAALESFAQKILPHPTERSPKAVNQLLELLKKDGLNREALEKAYLERGFGAVAKTVGLPAGYCEILFRHWGIKWKKPIRPWTAEEEQTIMQNYQKKTISEMATLFPSRTRNAVSKRMQAMRSRGKISQKLWMKVDNKEFTRLWNEKKSYVEIAKFFGITPIYADTKRRKLGLPPRHFAQRTSGPPLNAKQLAAIKDGWANGLIYPEIEKLTRVPTGRVASFTHHRWSLAVTARVNRLASQLWLPTELSSLAVNLAKDMRRTLREVGADRDLIGYRIVAPIALWQAAVKMRYPLCFKQFVNICPEFPQHRFRFSGFVPFERAHPDYLRWLAHLLAFPPFHQLGIQGENWKDVAEGCDRLFGKVEREGDGGLFLHTDPFHLVTAAVIMFGRKSIERRNPAQAKTFERTLCREFKPEERAVLYPLAKKIKWFMTTSTTEK